MRLISMEKFTVEAGGSLWEIRPLEDETFDVYKNGRPFFNIFPEIGIDTALSWSTGDLVSLELVQSIGEAIERKEA